MIQYIKCLCRKNKDLRSSPESTWEVGVQAYGCNYSEDDTRGGDRLILELIGWIV